MCNFKKGQVYVHITKTQLAGERLATLAANSLVSVVVIVVVIIVVVASILDVSIVQGNEEADNSGDNQG